MVRQCFLPLLGLFCMLWYTSCVVGGEQRQPDCKATTDCPGSQTCVSGFCISRGADKTNSEPGKEPINTPERSVTTEPDANQSDSTTAPDTTSETLPTEAQQDDGDAGFPEETDPTETLSESSSDASPELPPETGSQTVKRLFSPSGGGGLMQSVGYRLVGGVSLHPSGSPHRMSSQNYRLQAGFLPGVKP